MRRLVGVIIGFLLFFPGALVLQWLVVEELHLYQNMTLTDALLAIIIILASVLIFGQPRRPLTASELDEQARQMELASRRLEAAQRAHEQAVRSRRSGRRATPSSARTGGTSAAPPQARAGRPTRAERSDRTERSERSDRTSRRRR
ncbi:MAG: hypothetical protein GX131_13310 [candidate division WS1 bacterium]|jgi:type II secretory pathway pseudopilin PulG|nr:hypothetical protein [candidate division WS1 bacterium]